MKFKSGALFLSALSDIRYVCDRPQTRALRYWQWTAEMISLFHRAF